MSWDPGSVNESLNANENKVVELVDVKKEVKKENDESCGKIVEQDDDFKATKSEMCLIERNLDCEKMSMENKGNMKPVPSCKRKRKFSRKTSEIKGRAKKAKLKEPDMKMESDCIPESKDYEPAKQEIDPKSTEVLNVVSKGRSKNAGAKKTDMHCQICDISFARTQSMRKHMYLVHNEKDQDNPVCTQCNMIFKDRSDLEKHSKKHEEGEVIL